MNFFKSKPTKEKRYTHNLVKGDHVVRWTRMVVYPIQVHGIVLSASDDVVTIVDFGLTASSSTTKLKDEGNGNVNVNGESIGGNGANGANAAQVPAQVVQMEPTGIGTGNHTTTSNENDMPLEAMMNHEDRAIIEQCEKHRHEMSGPDRINILILTEEKDIKQWNRVEYKIEQKKKGGWFWQGNSNDCKSKSEVKDEQTKSLNEQNHNDGDDDCGENHHDAVSSNASIEISLENGKIEPLVEEPCIQHLDTNNKNETKCNNPTSDITKSSSISSGKSHNYKSMKEKEIPEGLRTRSDPTTIVLARVRYLISNPHVLPAHNIFYSNSECIAVWCKTGVWSTFQASVYLHSTAAGNFKTVVTAAAAVGTSTVTTTVPASGIAGWFGMTTTTTVSLVSLQPWLIPALAGWSLIAVGTPVLFLRKCHERWKKTTQTLNDSFWGEVDADVYVEAIKSWSGL